MTDTERAMQYHANGLLRRLDYEIFHGTLEVAKIPQAVDIVMSFLQAAYNTGRDMVEPVSKPSRFDQQWP